MKMLASTNKSALTALAMNLTWLLVCSMAWPVVAATPRGKDSAKQLLSRGKFYFNNGDVSDRAVRLFEQVTTDYPKSDEAEDAQLFIGRYYQRKYYIMKQRSRKEDPSTLYKAQRGYSGYVEKYSRTGTGRWLSDALFFLSIVQVQQREFNKASENLNRMFQTHSRDNLLSVYQIVWSPQSQSVVDAYMDAQELASFTLGLLKEYRGDFDGFVLSLTKWCKTHKRPPPRLAS